MTPPGCEHASAGMCVVFSMFIHDSPGKGALRFFTTSPKMSSHICHMKHQQTKHVSCALSTSQQLGKAHNNANNTQKRHNYAIYALEKVDMEPKNHQVVEGNIVFLKVNFPLSCQSSWVWHPKTTSLTADHLPPVPPPSLR